MFKKCVCVKTLFHCDVPTFWLLKIHPPTLKIYVNIQRQTGNLYFWIEMLNILLFFAGVKRVTVDFVVTSLCRRRTPSYL